MYAHSSLNRARKLPNNTYSRAYYVKWGSCARAYRCWWLGPAATFAWNAVPLDVIRRPKTKHSNSFRFRLVMLIACTRFFRILHLRVVCVARTVPVMGLMWILCSGQRKPVTSSHHIANWWRMRKSENTFSVAAYARSPKYLVWWSVCTDKRALLSLSVLHACVFFFVRLARRCTITSV